MQKWQNRYGFSSCAFSFCRRSCCFMTLISECYERALKKQPLAYPYYTKCGNVFKPLRARGRIPVHQKGGDPLPSPPPPPREAVTRNLLPAQPPPLRARCHPTSSQQCL